MARSFTSTDVVNFGSAASIDDCFNNDGTMAWWMFPTATTAALTFARKDAAIVIASFSAAGIQFTMARATLSLAVTISLANLPAWATNKWVFTACQWDAAGANGDQLWYGGDLATSVAVGTTYVAQRVGTGALTSADALSLLVGNSAAGNTAFPGNIGFFGLWNRRLSLGELKAQQYSPHMISGGVILDHMGFNSPELDRTGNGNSGTVTGTTVVSHVPIGRFFGAAA